MIAVLTLPAYSFALTATEIESLEKKCDKEMASPFRNKKTSSCDKLKSLQRGDKARDSTPKKEAQTYRWNGAIGKYCYYNSANEITSCP
jgi:hypothetical protein